MHGPCCIPIERVGLLSRNFVLSQELEPGILNGVDLLFRSLISAASRPLRLPQVLADNRRLGLGWAVGVSVP